MVKYCNLFLRETKVIKPLLVEFKEDNSIKSKIYSEDYVVGGLNRRPIIFVTNYESIFNINNGQWQVW